MLSYGTMIDQQNYCAYQNYLSELQILQNCNDLCISGNHFFTGLQDIDFIRSTDYALLYVEIFYQRGKAISNSDIVLAFSRDVQYGWKGWANLYFSDGYCVQMDCIQEPPPGYLEFCGVGVVPIQLNVLFPSHDLHSMLLAKNVREDWYADQSCHTRFNLSLTEYHESIIDYLITAQDVLIYTSRDTVVKSGENEITDNITTQNIHEVDQNIKSNSAQTCKSTYTRHNTTDYAQISIGHNFLENCTFLFIGPDREPFQCKSIEHYFEIAELVEATGVPNYRGARVPLHTNLNLQAWDKYLVGHRNQRLAQYLRFGFPLSIREGDREKLCEKKVTNHQSACDFPQHVYQYLQTEIDKGALLGPIENNIPGSLHCSPLLSRPKEGGKRRIIMNLSFPQGASLNDAVDRDHYDGIPFKLKFPTLDNIVEAIIQCDDPFISKIDIARAFRQLPIDPRDALKLGICWEGKYYCDIHCAFGFYMVVLCTKWLQILL